MLNTKDMDKTPPRIFQPPPSPSSQTTTNQQPNTSSKADENPKPYKPKLSLVIPATLITLSIFSAGVYFLPKKEPHQAVSVKKLAVKPKPTPTPNPASQWKLFINGNYGYQIKYPGNWYIKQLVFPDSKTIVDAQYLNDSTIIDYVNNRMSLVVTNDPIEKSLQFLNYDDKLTGFHNSSDVATVSASGREINKALIVTSQFDPITKNYFETGKSYQILIPLGENTLTLHAKLEDKAIADKILSTLTFIQQSPTPTENPKKKR